MLELERRRRELEQLGVEIESVRRRNVPPNAKDMHLATLLSIRAFRQTEYREMLGWLSR
jgi:hypothetical protein